jgi:hypothetical protein
LNTISSLNFAEIISGWHCPLSFSKDPSTYDAFYYINGAYTMLPIKSTPCLQTLSTTILNSVQSYLKLPIAVPSWVAELPEPSRSAAIYRSRKYGSPNVMEGFLPHVTVGFDPTTADDTTPANKHNDPNSEEDSSLSLKDTTNLQWRVNTMKQWNDAYEEVRETCLDNVEGIALGKSSVGGTVLANSRMGYWNLAKKDDGPDVKQNEYYAITE